MRGQSGITFQFNITIDDSENMLEKAESLLTLNRNVDEIGAWSRFQRLHLNSKRKKKKIFS